MISFTTLVIAFVVSAVLYIYSKRTKLPPGPLSLPILGSALAMGKQPFKKFLEWGYTYPQMCTIGLGGNQMIVLNDLKIIRDTFNDPRFAGRPWMDFNISAGGQHGVIHSEGQEWVEQRRFTLRHLRDFGFGKKTMESLILEDVSEFTTHLKSSCGKPISEIARRFNLIIINSLWTIISGKRHNHEDDEIAKILDTFSKAKAAFGALTVLFPKLAKLIPNVSGWGGFEKMVNMERDHAHNAIKMHQQNVPEDGIPRDFMDSYLKEIEATTDPSSSFYKERGVQSLIAVTTDLFNAGTDTTSTTLTWTILFISKFPEIQKKLQTEIDTVVGRSRQVSVADRPSLPYSEALFLEILRYSSIITFGVFHTNTEFVKDFYGYDIPAGTWITANHYHIHHSTKYFDEPEQFKPERFLSADGKAVKRSDALIPFSVGKRACLGETLARDEIFLFMTNIYQLFNSRLTDDSKDVSLDQKPGFGGEPFDYSVIFEERL